MLTSSSSAAANQYLRPEYLTPLPTTLDAKKSPLALLAQTCSQIGADPPTAVVPSSHKSFALNATSSSNNNNHVTHSSLSSSGKSKSSGPTGNYSINKSILHQDHHSTIANANANRKLSSASPSAERSHKKSHYSHQRESMSLPMSPSGLTPSASPPLITTTAATSSSPTPSPSTTSAENDKAHHQRPKTPSCHGSSSKASTPNPHNPSPPSSSFLNPSNKSPPTGSNLPLSETSTSSTLPPSSTSSGKLTLSGSSVEVGLKHPGMTFPLIPPTSGTGIPPYLQSYARLKAAAGANLDSLGMCRDPFCTGCHSGSHGINFHGVKGNCPGGCIGCEHHNGASSSFPGSTHYGPTFLSGLPLLPSLAAFYAAAASPAHGGPYSSAALHSLQPYICNWFVGKSYCGKRFSSSDDLLQHLRTHTTLGGGSNGTNQEAVQSLAAAALAAGYSPSGFMTPPSSHALLGASSHGIRTYPTPPLSPLSSARFHPYATAGKGLNGSAVSGLTTPNSPVTSSFFPSGFPLWQPAFAPYYPYSLYGPRLGGTGFLHP